MSEPITRCVDDLGRVVIPKEFRKALNISDGDALGITLENGYCKVIPAAKCMFCGHTLREHLMEKQGRYICFSCAVELGEEARGDR